MLATSFLNEAALLASLHSDFLLSLHGLVAIEPSATFGMIVEYCPQGELPARSPPSRRCVACPARGNVFAPDQTVRPATQARCNNLFTRLAPGAGWSGPLPSPLMMTCSSGCAASYLAA